MPRTVRSGYSDALDQIYGWASELIGPQSASVLKYVKFRPGFAVDPHVDALLSGARGMALFPLLWPDGASFETSCIVPIKPGDLWYFDHTAEHAVRNNSQAPMLALLFEVFR